MRSCNVTVWVLHSMGVHMHVNMNMHNLHVFDLMPIWYIR